MKYDIYEGQTLVLSLQKRKTEQGIIWEHIYDEMENESETQALIDALTANPDLKRWKQYTIFAFYTCPYCGDLYIKRVPWQTTCGKSRCRQRKMRKKR